MKTNSKYNLSPEINSTTILQRRKTPQFPNLAILACCAVALTGTNADAQHEFHTMTGPIHTTATAIGEEAKQTDLSLAQSVKMLGDHATRSQKAVRDYLAALEKDPADLSSDVANETMKAAFQLNERLIRRTVSTRSRVDNYRNGLSSNRNLGASDVQALEKIADELLESVAATRKAALAEHEFLRRYYLHVAKWQRTYQSYRNLAGDDDAVRALSRVIRETLPENQDSLAEDRDVSSDQDALAEG